MSERQKKTLTVKEVAARLDVSIPRVYQLIQDGRLEAEKFGRDWMISSDALTDEVMNRPNGRPSKDAEPETASK